MLCCSVAILVLNVLDDSVSPAQRQRRTVIRLFCNVRYCKPSSLLFLTHIFPDLFFSFCLSHKRTYTHSDTCASLLLARSNIPVQLRMISWYRAPSTGLTCNLSCFSCLCSPKAFPLARDKHF